MMKFGTDIDKVNMETGTGSVNTSFHFQCYTTLHNITGYLRT